MFLSDRLFTSTSALQDPIKVPQINMGRLDFPILDKECVINFCNKNDYFCYGSPNQSRSSLEQTVSKLILPFLSLYR